MLARSAAQSFLSVGFTAVLFQDMRECNRSESSWHLQGHAEHFPRPGHFSDTSTLSLDFFLEQVTCPYKTARS